MIFRVIRNDILKSKGIAITTLSFVTAAALLVSLAATLIVNLAGAIDTLMVRAKTPHFMQMHSGELDLAALTAFANRNEMVDEFQVSEFLNIDSAQIIFEEKSLQDSVQDNGFIVQSEKFDFLLDLEGQPIKVSDGEVFVPISYLQDVTARLGDHVRVHGKDFVVGGGLRDSQMNSLLASSKRFLISQNDFSEIKPFGNMEYLIEFRLKDPSRLGEFEAAYISAGLDANGPTLTYPLFRTINAISDGLMIAVILLVSALVVAVAFMCIRFTLLAKIEDDYREIGVMKAIGLRVSDIKKIYLAKYAAIAAAGSLLGFALSFAFREPLLANIRLYMGESANASFDLLLGSISTVVVFLSICAYVNTVLNRFRKISPAEAVRFGISQGKADRTDFFHLSQNEFLGTNIFLGVKDVLSRSGMYATMLAVLIISAFIIIVPQNLHNTISSNDFITYMGIGDSDMRIDIQQTGNIEEKAAEVAAALEADPSVAQFVVLTTRSYVTRLADGSEERLKIELGDHSIFPITYTAGRAPADENEIALSAANASGLNKKVGDSLTLDIDGRERRMTVSGIYSDVTNGGKTAKAVFNDESAGIMWSVISVDLADKPLLGQKIAEYGNRFDFAKVSDIDEYITQTFGSTIRSVGKAAFAAAAVSLFIAALVTLLFMRMLIAKDRYSVAILKALGFASAEIKTQYLSRSVFVLIVGVVLGASLANTLGESLAGAVIASFGASSFQFNVNPFSAYLLSPLMMAAAVLAAGWIGTMEIGKIKISENIKE